MAFTKIVPAGINTTQSYVLQNIKSGVITATDVRISGKLYDGDEYFGSSGQILSSDGQNLAWINASTTSVGSASSVGINLDSSDAVRYITFTDNVSGNGYIRVDSDLTYNPEANVLSVGVVSGNVYSTGISTFSSLKIENILDSVTGYVNTGIVTTLSGTNLSYSGIGTIGSAKITTLDASTGYINTGVVTALSGTNAAYTTGDFINLRSATGIITALSGTNLSYSGIGTIGSAKITTLDASTGYINTGVTTTLSGTNAAYTTGDFINLRSATGIITALSGTNLSYSGIGTIGSAKITTLDASTGYINTGVTTTLSGTIVSYITGDFNNLRSASGIVTSLSGTNLSYSGISTFNNTKVTTLDVSTGYINTGVTTTLSGTNVTYATGDFANLRSASGIVTALSGTNLSYSGIGTIGNAKVTTLDATTGYVNTGVTTVLSGTNVAYTTGDFTNLRSASGIVTALSGTNLSYSGVGTIGNAKVTTLDVSTGYINTGITTTLSGTNVSYTTGDFPTLRSNVGIITTLSGTNLSYSGVSTFSNGPILIGSGTSTGTSSQRLQVIGSAYVSDNLGIGTTSPVAKLDVSGNIFVGVGNTILVGYSSVRSNFSNTTTQSAALQLEGTDVQRRIAVISDDASSSGGTLILAHQRSGSVGGNTLLQEGDQLGAVVFQGSDGSEFIAGSAITTEIEGTPAANSLKSSIIFNTNPGASGASERMRITGIGSVGIGTTAPRSKVDIDGGTLLANTQERSVSFGSSESVFTSSSDSQSTGFFNVSLLVKSNNPIDHNITQGRGYYPVLFSNALTNNSPGYVSNIYGVTNYTNVSGIGTAIASAVGISNNVWRNSSSDTSTSTFSLTGIVNTVGVGTLVGSGATFSQVAAITNSFTISKGNTQFVYGVQQNSTIGDSSPDGTSSVYVNEQSSNFVNTLISGTPVSSSGITTVRDYYGFRHKLTVVTRGNITNNLYAFYVENPTVIGSVPTRRYSFYNADSSGIIYSNGAVGIGSTIPNNRLDVTGNAYFSGNVGFGTTSGATKIHVTGGNVRIDGGFGVDFSSATGSLASKILDDYEEGTWTPTIAGTTSAGVCAYGSRYGRYTKIGRMVHVELYVSWSSGTGTGNLIISTLPFTPNNASTYGGAAIGYMDSVAVTAGNTPMALFENNTAQIRLSSMPSGGGTMAYIAYDSAGSITLSGSYSV